MSDFSSSATGPDEQSLRALQIDALYACSSEIEGLDRQRAAQLSAEALTLARELQDGPRVARGLLQLATLEWRLSCYDEALEHAAEALACFRALGDRHGEAWSLRLLGNIHGVQSQYAPAAELLRAAAGLSREVGNTECLASCLNNLGIIANELGDYASALESLFEALRLYEEGDPNIPSSLNNVATLYQLMGQYEQALDFHRQALSLADIVPPHPLTAALLHNLAETQRRSGQNEQAMAVLQRALGLARQIGDRQTEMLALDSLGQLYQAAAALDQARSCFEQGLELAAQVRHPLGEVRLLMHHATLLPDPAAREHLMRALAIAREVNLKAEARAVHDLLVGLLKRAGEFQQALAHHEQARTVERELFNEAQDKRIQALRIQYELAQARAVNVSQQSLNEQLRRANEELDAFSYSISHDLRAPIRHIGSFAGMLRQSLEQGKTEQASRFLGIIEQSAVRMNALVDALLLLARQGRSPLNPAFVDLSELVHEVLHDLEPEMQGRQVRWNIGELPVVRGDVALLRQVFYNLLSNALKYSQPRAEAIIEVRAERREQEWLLEVQDNGVGFDPRFAAKLFGVFQRLHRAEDFEGTGVGLANVQRIVHRHGGTVWASAKEGEGATFSFTLPA
ncbi:sensor histidine kinase [Deinococcus peraridilitoris]|uniref:histidine kinase n=1 Tax=Deinococcus peraridilitoris (strain DSM 19664 / LMG 22246 / CIP 109416 / KR-200) TaxID=937777 RepID=L0A4J6_DEIPD|nr:tetratricopeptide repeat protein [Deinococcus peraridilitoris]AFZ67950.1 bacteriophytochrome (light-regulated signal transduction histidine kinase) [Deinococcus peraridilitoris DSM 19664]